MSPIPRPTQEPQTGPGAFERLCQSVGSRLARWGSAPRRLLEAIADHDEPAFDNALATLSRHGPFDASDALVDAFCRPESDLFFKRLLHAGARPDALLPGGSPLIHQAALDPPERLWRLHALLRAGADPALADPQGRNALAMAAYGANADAVSALIQAGCPLNALDHNGATALIHSLRPMAMGQRRDRRCFDLLFHAGADFNLGLSQHGEPALILLIDDRDESRSRLLLELGADASALLKPAPRHFPLTRSQRAFREPLIAFAQALLERQALLAASSPIQPAPSALASGPASERSATPPSARRAL